MCPVGELSRNGNRDQRAAGNFQREQRDHENLFHLLSDHLPGCAFAVGFGFFGRAAASYSDRERAAAAPSFLLTLVERELAKAPVDGAALEAIYRRVVRSPEDASTFFYSASFLRLDLAGQRRVIDTALELDSATFLQQTEFLPFALRAEYRGKALQATEEIQLAPAGPAFSRRAGAALSTRPRRHARQRRGRRSVRPIGAGAPLPARPRPPPARRGRKFLGRRGRRSFLSAESLVEAKVLLTRNLSGRGLAPSRANVALVWAELEAARAELAELRLFAGRNVVLAAGKDERQGPTFGKTTTLAALREQAPASLQLLRSGERGAGAELARAIAQDGQLTLILETHGRPGALEFSGALEADELAAMFAGRREKGQAIVIVNACFGHDFARAFAERLRSRGLPVPILVVPEEFGQATLVGRQESPFTRDELGLGARSISTLRNLWPGQYRETTVYAPLAQGLAQLR